jgi:hypothetical protein
MQREAHVWAAVVDSVNEIAVREQAERVALDVNNEASSLTHLGKRRGADEAFRGSNGHGLLLFTGEWAKRRDASSG